MNNSQRYVSQHFLSIVVFLQVAMYVSLFLNFQLAREVIGIFYLTFIPGLILIRLLKLELNNTELIIYATGFSVAFLMIAGLAINEVGSIVGFSFPLATLPLSLFINTIIIIGAAAAHLRQEEKQPAPVPQKTSFSPAFLILTLIPVISILGSYSASATGNNFLLLLMIVAIALVFTLGAFYGKSTNIYPFAIFMVALALLFQVSLLSNYLVPYGGDSPAEFYVFRTTQLAAHWNPTFMVASDEVFGRYNAMLSITILPTVYSNMLGMDPTSVFKIIYPLIFALVPVALYVLWQPYIGKKFAFISAFLFMAQSSFYTELTALDRQVTGELFFVLLLIVLLNKTIKSNVKFAAFGIFSIGLIFSHYALAEIFLFLMFAAWAVIVFYLKRPSLNLQLGMILFFFAAMFGWYIFTSGSVVFDSVQTFGTFVLSQLGGFFDPASRGTQVLTGLGLTQSPSVWNTISRGFAYLTELFIVIGVVALLAKKTKFRFERDYIVFGMVAFAFLVALIAVPGLANALNMTRFYHILLIVLAPFCIIGMWSLVHLIFKLEKKVVVSLLIVAILVPYFLFQTNFVYEVAGTDSWSIPLSGYRMDPVRLYGEYGYIDPYSVYGAQWLSTSVPYQNNTIGDNGLYSSLTAYGLVYRGYVTGLSNYTVIHSGEYAYLSYITVNYEQASYNNTILPVFNQANVIYSNGGSEVYYGTK
jgi:uncharacterized membrane protein